MKVRLLKRLRRRAKKYIVVIVGWDYRVVRKWAFSERRLNRHKTPYQWEIPCTYDDIPYFLTKKRRHYIIDCVKEMRLKKINKTL